MAKYIDADRLDGWGIRLSRTTERGDEVITTNAMELANVLTAADVIEVVRCKDCKHYAYADGVCRLLTNNYYPLVEMDEDDYCSKGVRNE